MVRVHALGKNAGKAYTQVARYQPKDASDTVYIAKGGVYYKWSLFMQLPCVSKVCLRPSQTAINAFYQAYYAIQERLQGLTVEEDATDGLGLENAHDCIVEGYVCDKVSCCDSNGVSKCYDHNIVCSVECII